MKLIPYDMEELKTKREYANLRAILSEFEASELNCVEVVDYPHTCANVCASCLHEATKRHKMFNIGVVRRRNQVFLIKKR